jgi:hypothetical protein
VVFNVPPEFTVLARYCQKELYDAVIRAAAQAIIDVGWSKLHARLGPQIQLQTWTESMAYLIHAHCVVPCGGFSEDGSRWISFEPHDLPASALSDRFRTLLCKAIRRAVQRGRFKRLPKSISVDEILLAAMSHEWNVYAEPPFGGSEQLLAYLAQYINRVAITNDRIELYENHQVTFRGRDDANGQVKLYRLEGAEFVERYVQHVPPKGFMRIRSYGFMANRNRKRNLEKARQLIGQTITQPSRERVRPMRLCPACYEARRAHGLPCFAASPNGTPSGIPDLRPPPNPLAA